MRRFVVNGGLIAGSLIVGFALIEIAVRFAVPAEAPYALHPTPADAEVRPAVLDQRGFWTWRPGYRGVFDNRVDFTGRAVHTDPQGGRLVPCAPPGDTGHGRVFLLGDSQTFGWGLSDAETWANHLQCGLEGRAPGRFRVRNFGFPGAQADQVFVRGIKQVVPALRPGDTVVASMSWNDLVNFYAGRPFVDQALKQLGLGAEPDAGGGVRLEPLGDGGADGVKADPRALDLQLAKPLRFLNPPSWRYAFYRKTGLFVPAFDSLGGFLSSMRYASAAYRLAWTKARVLYNQLRPVTAFAEGLPAETFANNFLIMAALDAAVRKRGARMIVQLLPSRLFFDAAYYPAYSKGGTVFPSRDYMGHVAGPFCARLGLRCVNRFAVLKTNTPDAHSFRYDGHYNGAGARAIAAALVEDLLR